MNVESHGTETAVAQAVREHPILFSAPMVKAILAGPKTQTRRLVRWTPRMPGFDLLHSSVEAGHYATGVPSSGWVLRSRGDGSCWNDRTLRQQCRYGVPGDRLWVRETWYCDHFAVGDFEYTRKKSFIGKVLSDAECIAEWRGRDPDGGMMYYRADGEGHQQFEQFDPEGFAWRPSIFMPRWASRILLEVTEVRVERLQAISEDDARAEGVDLGKGPRNGKDWASSARDAFSTLWDSINGERAPWASNPWVWAVSFRRLEP